MDSVRSHSPVRGVALPALLVLLPVLVSYAILGHFARSLPMFDDYQALILFSTKYLHAPGMLAKITYVFTDQHDEYKLIFEHILFGIDLSAFGHIHYMFMLWLGNLFVAAILAVYWFQFLPGTGMRRRLLLFAPVSFLLFQLNYVETLDWAMCGLQMIAVIFFSFLAIALLLRVPRRAFVWACVVSFVAILASANGFLLAPVGMVLLAQRRAWRRVVAYVVPFAVGAAIYFYHYGSTYRQNVVPHPTIGQKLWYFLSYCGGAVENLHHIPFRGASVLVGLCIVAAFVYALKNRVYQSSPFFVYTAGWMLLCAAGVAQVRIRLGMDGSLTMRYKLYSDLLMIFTYVVIAEALRRRQPLSLSMKRMLYAAALALSVLLYASSGYFGARFLKTRMNMEETAFRNYLADPSHPSPLVDIYSQPLAEGGPAKVWTDEAIAMRAYIPPANVLP